MTLLSADEARTAVAGNGARFGGRWRLVGAGLSNVWRYGDLELPANSGRLLLRGPNGTGKTTALEALWPYLLDLDAARLQAGKARNTSLSGLMREGADGKRRVGYLWLSFAGPRDQAVVSYGVRLSFSDSSTPPVRVTPFTVPGRPLHELALWAPGRATLSAEAFTAAVTEAGGVVFDDEQHYVRDLATRLFGTEPRELAVLAARIRSVRNPALLGEVSAAAAADALRESLPSVAEDVIEATGDALVESDETRKAFERDREAAGILSDFARTWSGHATEVVRTSGTRAEEAAGAVRRAQRAHADLTRKHESATEAASAADARVAELRAEQRSATGEREAIESGDEYRAAGRLKDLEETLHAQEGHAEAAFGALQAAASSSARLARAAKDQVDDAADDVGAVLDRVTSTIPEVAGAVPLHASWRARPVLAVGDRGVDQGPALDVEVGLDALDALVDRWQTHAAELERQSNTAKLCIRTHGRVLEARVDAEGARREANRLAEDANERGVHARHRSEEARQASARLRAAVLDWRTGVAHGPGWSSDDVADIGWDEPGIALAGVEQLAATTLAHAHAHAAAARGRAQTLLTTSSERRSEASELRAEAEHLREEGAVLPLPRPQWAGSGDDAVALGTAIDWVDGVPQSTQDLLEATLAAAGVLGATLDPQAATTATWSVQTTGPVVEPNLASLLRADPTHPLAAVAEAVLVRIALAERVTDAEVPGLAIGTDGSFRAGVLVADVVEALGEGGAPGAQHIGAGRRREAALRRAAELDEEALVLDGEAQALEAEARREQAEAQTVLGAADLFPERATLRDAESARAAAANAADAATAAAARAEALAETKEAVASEAQQTWMEEVSALGLPAQIDTLTLLAEDAGRSKTVLGDAANQLTRFRPRLERLVDAAATHAAGDLSDALADARLAFEAAEVTRATHRTLLAVAGTGAAHALEAHRQVTERLDELDRAIQASESAARAAQQEMARLGAKVEDAQDAVQAAAPQATAALAELRRLLAVPGVAEAVLEAEVAAGDPDLLAQVKTAVSTKATSAKQTLRQRADVARAALAGVWSLDPGVDHPELDTYVLTHRDSTYTPVGAAVHASALAEQAEKALRAQDEAALRDFVVGRLPAAIAAAWTNLFDWRDAVNRKMRTASSSSGVGVAVRLHVSDDLPPAARTVWELTCKTGETSLSPDARARAGAAIQDLIAASDSDDMASRVRDAVDVRSWVDVTYEVTRPGQEPRTWTRRTGLSGGERRLVVLAPMLAAVAAAYDRFPPTAPRLAALDEVPAEVDERGREGLARYLAELDLDLIATSYLWDGAPGAWDGVDAHDLDAGPDGTVVAFPMVVRGPVPLPGDNLRVPDAAEDPEDHGL